MVITASRTNVKDPDLAVYELLKSHRTEILNHYDLLDTRQDEEEILELIARKLNRLRSGGVPDIETTAKMILQEWQKGRIQI